MARLIKDGNPVSAAETNPPIAALLAQVSVIRQQLDSIQAGSNIVIRDVPLADGVSEGHVVYLDGESETAMPAYAAWSDVYAPNGEVTPSESSLFTGVVLRAEAGIGDIGMEGAHSLHSNAVNNLTGGEPLAPGQVYYLSSTAPGTVQTAKPTLAVTVLQAISSSQVRVLSPSWLPITHTHREYFLDADGWADVVGFTNAPVGATYGFNFNFPSAQEQRLADVLLASVGGPHFHFVSDAASDPGILVDSTFIRLDMNGLWWFAVAPPDDDIRMNVTHVDASGIPMVHEVVSQSDGVTVEQINGRAIVRTPELTVQDDDGEDPFQVVTEVDLANGAVHKTPVVSKVSWGRGIRGASTQADGRGQVVLQLAGFDDELLPATIVNLNNAVTTVEDPLVLWVLPEGRSSQIACSRVLPVLGTARYKLVFRFNVYGPQPGEPMPGVTYRLMDSASSEGADIQALQFVSMPNAPATAVATKAYLIESDEIDLTYNSRGSVFFSIRAVDPSNNIRIFDIGVTLKIQP